MLYTLPCHTLHASRPLRPFIRFNSDGGTRIRCGGRFAPRSVEAEEGDLVRRAQSRGEWPGERMTFLLLRAFGG